MGEHQSISSFGFLNQNSFHTIFLLLISILFLWFAALTKQKKGNRHTFLKNNIFVYVLVLSQKHYCHYLFMYFFMIYKEFRRFLSQKPFCFIYISIFIISNIIQICIIFMIKNKSFSFKKKKKKKKKS